MKFEWDPDKNARNIRERGIDFSEAMEFEWPTAVVVEDLRREYGELRLRAMGKISGRLHVLVFTLRDNIVRIISLRRANKREEHMYEKVEKN